MAQKVMPSVLVQSTIVKKLAADKFRYFFQFQNLSDQPLDTLVSIRVYPRFFRLFCAWAIFRVTLPATWSGSASIDAPFLYKHARFQWKSANGSGRGQIAASREDLTTLFA